MEMGGKVDLVLDPTQTGAVSSIISHHGLHVYNNLSRHMLMNHKEFPSNFNYIMINSMK